MAIDIPFDGIDPDAVGGYDTVAPGLFHGKVVNVIEEYGDRGNMVVDVEVLRHSVSNQIGKVHREFFTKDLSKETFRRKFLAFALATELTTVDEVKQLAAHGKSPSIEYTHAVGKQVVMKMEENDYNGKVSTRMSWDSVFHPAHKKANDCPLDMAAINAAGIKLPEGRNPDGAVAFSKPAGNPSKASTPNPSKQAGNVGDLLNGM